MTTKKKADTFAATLTKRETEATVKADEARQALAAEREKIAALDGAVETTTEAAGKSGDARWEGQRRRDRAGAGRGSGKTSEVAQMGHDGATNRAKRLTDWLGKQSHDKAVAEIVRDVLVQRVMPGAPSYATFDAGGFTKDAAKPDTLPALVVTQLDGGHWKRGSARGQGPHRLESVAAAC